MSFVIGLTGGIACGKSTIAAMFKERGIPIFNADRYVHGLLSKGGEAVADIADHFPNAIAEDGSVDRQKLGEIVFSNDSALEQLEAILHPKVRAGELEFIATRREEHIPICVLEVPLLYETRADSFCDMTVVVDCEEATQRARAMARDGMTEEKLEHVLSRQLSRQVRNEKADLVISTEHGEEKPRKLVEQLIATLKE